MNKKLEVNKSLSKITGHPILLDNISSRFEHLKSTIYNST